MVSREVYESLSNIAATEGRGFVSLHFEEDLSKDDGSDRTNLYIENPDASGIYVILSAPIVTSDRVVEIDAYKNVTKDVAGTTEPTINQRTDGSDSSVANVEHNIQYSGGTFFGVDQAPGGGFNTAGFTTEDDAILIAPGDNYLVDVQNISAATIDVGIKFKFAETLEKNIPPAWSP